MNKVSLKRIVGNVVGDLGITNVNNIFDDFARWAVDAELAIGSRLSYEHVECEIDVKNSRAPLPENIVRLNKLKVGNKLLEVTNRNFHQFFKGSENASKIIDMLEAPTAEVCPDACNLDGVPMVVRIYFTGTFATSDVITITFAYSNCGSVSTNSFTYIVLPGDDIPAIMDAIALQINAIQDIGFTAVVSNGYISIEADSYQVNINTTTYTNSILGVLSDSIYQKRVIPKNSSATTPMSNMPQVGSPNLAEREALMHNTGMLRDTQYNSIWGNSDDPSVTKFAISNNCIHINNSGIDKVGISYERVKLDCDGWPEISDTHERAVTQYLIFKYRQKLWRAGKVGRGDMKEEQFEWFRLCSQARGNATLPNPAEMEMLANHWNQLIPMASKELF